jgi:cytochrome c oxidase cbb3-type subunit 4
MDVNDLRAVITVVSLGLFIGIVWWAWSSRRKKDFDEAARLALDDDDKPAPEKRADE